MRGQPSPFGPPLSPTDAPSMPKRQDISRPGPGLAITPPSLLTSGTATRSRRSRMRPYMIEVESRPVRLCPASSLSQWKLQAFHGAPFISRRSNWCTTSPASASSLLGRAFLKRVLSIAARAVGLICRIGMRGVAGGGDGVPMMYVSWCVSTEQCSFHTSFRRPHFLYLSSQSTVTVVTHMASQPGVFRQMSLQPFTPPTSARGESKPVH